MRWKTVFLAAGLGAGVLLAGAGEARADHNCWRKIAQEESKLDRDVRKHGWYSRQAEHRRARLHRLRAECGGGFAGRPFVSQWRGHDGHRRWDRRLGRGFDFRCDRDHRRGHGRGHGWRR